MKKLFVVFGFFLLFSVSGQENNTTQKKSTKKKKELSSADMIFLKKMFSLTKIPFTHFDYNWQEKSLDKDSSLKNIGIKPYYQFDNLLLTNKINSLFIKSSSLKEKKSWFKRKLLHEHFFNITGDDYWVSIDPVINAGIGKDNLSIDKTVYQNTRGIKVTGGLGKKFIFSSTILENMAHFPKFLDRYAWQKRPPVIPGYGLNKSEDLKYVDYPHAEGYFVYKPSQFFTFDVGHGNHFIGEGYRSLFLSDNAGVYPYFKIDATFWHVKYTTMWTAYQDVRPEVTVGGVFRKKFSATHYISWNASKKLNFGFFETVIWHNENKRGFDVNFLNPLIFFKTVEYESGSNGSNTIMGLSSNYQILTSSIHKNNSLNVYGQFVLDEMTISKFFGDSGYWANKFGYQIGIKYLRNFQNSKFFTRFEYNTVRPYTFSHTNLITNYGHNYQALAHPWGANFKEFIFETQFKRKRLYAYNLLNIGKKGFDFPLEDRAYGGDIFHYIKPENRSGNHQTLQGNLGNILMNRFETGYLINPSTNLKIFGGFIYRKTAIEQETRVVKNETTKYFYFGIKTHLWNDHFDLF